MCPTLQFSALALIQAKIYLKGDKDFCSIAADGKLALIGLVKIPPNDARSVAIPIVPKRIGEVQIEVSSILQLKLGGWYRNAAGDAIIKKLLVVVSNILRTRQCERVIWSAKTEKLTKVILL